MLCVRPCLTRKGGAGDAQHAQALDSHIVDGSGKRSQIGSAKVAKLGDGFRCTLCGDDKRFPAVVWLPDVRHGQETWAQPIGVQELPFRTVQMSGPNQLVAPEIMKRLFHRVERVARTGKKAELRQIMEVFRQSSAGCLAESENRVVLEPQLGDRHSVLGKRAGLVGA